jgi:hypothetical protein
MVDVDVGLVAPPKAVGLPVCVSQAVRHMRSMFMFGNIYCPSSKSLVQLGLLLSQQELQYHDRHTRDEDICQLYVCVFNF